ncbi:methyltransferase domain-containing protein, partial [Aliarcobacter cryaerophilus]|uniref:methyltransferase domain-containing protein n=1 Tax=Aliarcobacter cryaerophilus TaxID=28198 RepID=UPI003DA21289
MNKELAFTGERYIPEYFSDSCDEIVKEHEDRYSSISKLVADKVVLDAACGSGYGSFEISKYAKSVRGIDISADSIQYAKNNYSSKNLEFNEASVTEIPFLNDEFDVVVSFETIEHISEEQQILFLKQIKRVLKEDGILIISTPDKLNYSDKMNYINEFHIKEFYEKEFYEFLSLFFRNIEFYYQTQEICNLIYNKNSMKMDFDCMNQDISGKYIIAVCSDFNIDNFKIGAISLENNKINFLNSRILSLQNEVEEKNKWAFGLNLEIDRINTITENLNQELETKEQSIKNLNDEIEAKEQQIQKQNQELETKEQSIKNL